MIPFKPTLLLVGLVVFSSPSVLRAADGDLDTSFNGGAIRVLWGNESATATTLLPLSGDRLLVGGMVDDPPRWAVSKITSGGLEEIGWSSGFTPFGFGNEGASEAGDLLDMWRDPAGVSEETMMMGWVEISAGVERPALARLTAAGGLDATFDGNGLKIVSPPPSGWSSISITGGTFLPDGGAVFVGSCTSCLTAGVRSVLIVKVLASGTPDTAFSGDGWMSLTREVGTDYSGAAIAVDHLGRLLVAGRYSDIGSTSYFFARVTATGSFDGSFGGGDGLTESRSLGFFADLRDVAIDPSSGRIALALRLSSDEPADGAVEVFTDAGLEDETFSGDGRVDIDLEEGSSLDSVAFQSDGKLLAVGTIDATGTQTGGFLLARMRTTGVLDTTFDGNGVKRVEFDAAPDVADAALAVTTWGGRLLAAGFAGAGGGDEQAFALLRTENASIFKDGFERGSSSAWAGY